MTVASNEYLDGSHLGNIKYLEHTLMFFAAHKEAIKPIVPNGEVEITPS